MADNTTQIQSKIVAIIADKLGLEESEITAEASFTDDLGADLAGHRRTHHGV